MPNYGYLYVSHSEQ